MVLWLSPILITLLVATITIAVTAMISLRIKFAPDQNAARRERKESVTDLLRWAATFGVIGLLFYQVSIPEPLTRVDALLLVLNVGVLLLALIISLILQMIDQVYRKLYTLVDVLTHQAKTTTEALNRNIAVTNTLVEGLSERRGRRAGDVFVGE